VSFYGPGALSWLPTHWVSADRPGRSRFAGPRHLAVTGQQRLASAELAHLRAVPPNEQSSSALALDENEDEVALLGDVVGSARGPVLACAWDKLKRGVA